jgi:hypothetical protein
MERMTDKTHEQKSAYKTVTIEGKNWQLKIPVIINCFYCDETISEDERFMYAQFRYHYKRGGTRYKDRTFHLSC